MTTAQEVITLVSDFGFFDVLVPFLLAFALTWGLLEKTMVFGKEAKGGPKVRLNVAVATVVGLLAVVVLGRSVHFESILLTAVVLLFVVFSLFFLAGIAFGEEWRGHLLVKIIVAVIAVLVIFITLGFYRYLLFDPWILVIVLGTGVFIWVIYYIARSD